MSSLADYLAKNYLTAEPGTTRKERPKKKRKKTAAAAVEDGLIIADDDPSHLLRGSAFETGGGGDDDDDQPALVTGRSAEFRKTKKSNWKSISGGNNNNEQDEADAIIASAAAENATRKGINEEEDAPAIVDEGLPRMESGARAGLQTAEQTAAMVAGQERARKREAAQYKSSGQEALAKETIYRDASGRIINVAMKRAEARQAEREKKEKEEQERENLMGDVQRRERENRKHQLQEARAMPLTGTVADEALNDELRSRQRWNDPAAQFLTSSGGGGAGLSVTGKPLYKGPFQPNRYGIRPGHRWDGVDRGTGFEKEWFTSRNRRGRLEALEYEWQMDE